jgi:Iap family predicted aminopeptidase
MVRFVSLFILWLVCTASAYGQITFVTLPKAVIESRLKLSTTKNKEREKQLVSFFNDGGCTDKLVEAPVNPSNQPNVVCTLPGETDEVIIVGAHFDQVDVGKGIVDNWSGASLLPSLYESLKAEPRRHTIVFIGFTDEERGLVGSEFYAAHIKKPDLEKIAAMVNMDTLGLGPTEVWLSHADKQLASYWFRVAKAMSAPLLAVNVEKVGTTDSESFARRKVPSITIHSLTAETMPILHSAKDQAGAIKMDDYYESYRLIAAYIAYLDKTLGPAPVAAPTK